MEKERLEKVRQFYSLGKEFSFLNRILDKKKEDDPQVKNDLIELVKDVYREFDCLFWDLYPEAPKDLMEEVKKRMEAYRIAKEGTSKRIPSLSLKQKFGLLFKR